jgi:phosphate transport system substrate-binding protein
LYIYLNKPPAKPLDPPILEFVKYVLSKDGQNETIRSGFYPITNETRTKALKTLGVSDGAQ